MFERFINRVFKPETQLIVDHDRWSDAADRESAERDKLTTAADAMERDE